MAHALNKYCITLPMSRPLRIEYPDAWYHIMNRCERHKTIFEGKNDYSLFLELLQETIEIFHCTVVPMHRGETIGCGLLAQILRDCEITKDELQKKIYANK